MKVYVDGEMPKNCFECPCFCGDSYFPCGLGDGTQDYFLDEIDCGECPLLSLADYTKQVRKEVCDKIYRALTSEHGWHRMKGWYCVNDECEELREFLDQIQGETKC